MNQNVNLIILAAGKSKRARKDKLLSKIKSKHVIEITVENFSKIKSIKKIIIAVPPEKYRIYSKIFNTNSKVKLTEGSDTRTKSLINASKEVDEKANVVMVHDAARPFASQKLIRKIINATQKYGAVIPVIRLKDTVKHINIKKNTVIKTIDRNTHFAVQTPQSYTLSIFKKLIENANNPDTTDDSQILERLNIPVKVIDGEETNIKITTPLDFKIAEVIYEEKSKTDKK